MVNKFSLLPLGKVLLPITAPKIPKPTVKMQFPPPRIAGNWIHLALDISVYPYIWRRTKCIFFLQKFGRPQWYRHSLTNSRRQIYFSYASSSTLYPYDWVSEWAEFQTSVVSRLASLLIKCCTTLWSIHIWLVFIKWRFSKWHELSIYNMYT